MSAAGTSGVSIDVSIGEGRTVVDVTGTRDAAVIVRSVGGEEIYLPPENFRDSPGASPDRDRSSVDSPNEGGAPAEGPYEGSAPADSPYEAATTDSSYEGGDGGGPVAGTDAEGRETAIRTLGVQSTADGFRIVHPEPVRELRLVR